MPQVLLQVQRQDRQIESDSGDYLHPRARGFDLSGDRRSGSSGDQSRARAVATSAQVLRATMQRISREQSRKYAFDWEDEPLLRVQCGESFEIETHDASTGYFQSEKDKAIPALRPGFNRSPPLANPIGGPVWLEGAELGDTLVITIEDILVGDFSWIAVGPKRGPLGESTRWPELSADYTTKIFRHSPGPSGTLRDGVLRFNDRISWPITPFVGTIGVAPEREVTTSIDGQGPWGGNLDIRDVAPSNRIL